MMKCFIDKNQKLSIDYKDNIDKCIIKLIQDMAKYHTNYYKFMFIYILIFFFSFFKRKKKWMITIIYNSFIFFSNNFFFCIWIKLEPIQRKFRKHTIMVFLFY